MAIGQLSACLRTGKLACIRLIGNSSTVYGSQEPLGSFCELTKGDIGDTHQASGFGKDVHVYTVIMVK